MYNKSDFYNAAMAHLAQLPELSAKVAAGDVTVTQHMGAIAQMAAMLSVQVDLGLSDYWTRARNSFVLADAAHRQILPFARPKIYRISAVNSGSRDIAMQAGRIFLDTNGRTWYLRETVGIAARNTASLVLVQGQWLPEKKQTAHGEDFYSIPITPPEAGQALAGLRVMVNGREFSRAEGYNNVAPGDAVYFAGADNRLNLFVRFGVAGVAGYVPAAGDEIQIIRHVIRTGFQVAAGDAFELAYVSGDEADLSFFADEVLDAGALPPTVDELRRLCAYPALYDENAVYLGEFDFLIRRKMPPFVFLSVWNEAVEESARGADAANINTLFVSFIGTGDKEQTKRQITDIIRAADNSYSIRFVEAQEVKIKAAVKAYVSSVYDARSTAERIKGWILSNYGRESAFAAQKHARVNVSALIRDLKAALPELHDGTGDLSVDVTQAASRLPEQFCFAAADTVSVVVEAL